MTCMGSASRADILVKSTGSDSELRFFDTRSRSRGCNAWTLQPVEKGVRNFGGTILEDFSGAGEVQTPFSTLCQAVQQSVAKSSPK